MQITDDLGNISESFGFRWLHFQVFIFKRFNLQKHMGHHLLRIILFSFIKSNTSKSKRPKIARRHLEFQSIALETEV